MFFAARRERRREVIDLRDGVALDDGRQAADVGAVERLVREAGHTALRRQVAGDHGIAAMAIDQRLGELAADLAVGADDQNLRRHYRPPPMIRIFMTQSTPAHDPPA